MRPTFDDNNDDDDNDDNDDDEDPHALCRPLHQGPQRER